jgi:hypothetical protein
MTVLHAGLLAAGLAAVAIPILIHLLLRQRRKPIQWAAMRFLIEAYRRQRRKLRLQQLLLLAARCLVIILLALAIARPLFERAGVFGAGGARDVYLLVDNGLASAVRDPGTGQTALERHAQEAEALLATLGPGDRAGLITLGAPASRIVVPASSDIAGVRRLLQGVEPTAAATDLPAGLDALATAVQTSADGDERQIVGALLSDFRRGSADVSRPLPRTLAQTPSVVLLGSEPADTPIGNVQIIDVEPMEPVVLTGEGRAAEQTSVRVRLRRSGADAAVSTVRLRSARSDDDRARPSAQATVRWDPGQTEASTTLTVDTVRTDDDGPGLGSAHAVLIAEIDRDTLDADNTFRRPISIVDALDVGIITQRRFGARVRADALDAAGWLRFALEPQASHPVTVREIEPASIDLPVLSDLNAVVIPEPDLLADDAWTLLRRYADAGGLVIVCPPADATVHLWTDAFVSTFDLEWSFAREPIESTPDDPLLLETTEQSSIGMLAQLSGDLEEILKPVGVFKALAPESVAPTASVLLTLADGAPWLIAQQPGTENEATGRGVVIYLASAPVLTWTDLPARPLMVPLVQEILKQGVGDALGTFAGVAGRPLLAPRGTSQLRRPDAPDAAPTEVDAVGLARTIPRTPGVLGAYDAANRPRGLVAINADADAGQTDLQDASVVRTWIEGAMLDAGQRAGSGDLQWLDPTAPAAGLDEQRARSPISVPLLIAALIIALLETIMARAFSHAFQERTSAGAVPA